jgi:hypothetical protein
MCLLARRTCDVGLSCGGHLDGDPFLRAEAIIEFQVTSQLNLVGETVATDSHMVFGTTVGAFGGYMKTVEARGHRAGWNFVGLDEEVADHQCQ